MVETVCTAAAVSVDTTGVELEAVAGGIDSYTVGEKGRRVCGGGEESVGREEESVGREEESVWGRGGECGREGEESVGEGRSVGERRRVCKKIWRWGWNGEKEIHVLE